MSDEIGRLRRMRQAALDTRVLAGLLNDTGRRESVAGRAAVLCWRVARSATAQLRAHPHRAYHTDPGLFEGMLGRFHALKIATPAHYRKRPMGALQSELLGLSRVIDDVRSLTLSADLSDTLGRGQKVMRELLAEVAGRARAERGWRPAAESDSPMALAPPNTSGSSPYLAL